MRTQCTQEVEKIYALLSLEQSQSHHEAIEAKADVEQLFIEVLEKRYKHFKTCVQVNALYHGLGFGDRRIRRVQKMMKEKKNHGPLETR